MNHAMLDLETFGTTPGCLVVAIGAVRFSAEGVGETFYRTINPRGAQGTIDPGTVLWWLAQSESARREVIDASALAATALLDFGAFWKGHDAMWAHGLTFDVPILEAFWRNNLHASPPWNHRVGRDTRTLFDQAIAHGWERCVMPVGAEHNALEDARYQAMDVISAAKHVGWEL